jgi:uncharacterized protein YjbJ (UPF0337 family)
LTKIKRDRFHPAYVCPGGRPTSWGTAADSKEDVMDKDRVAGSAKVVKGKIKEAVGRAVGDAKLQSEGQADKIEGQVQNAVGGLKDAIRGK